MERSAIWPGMLGTALYAIQLVILVFFGDLVLMASTPGYAPVKKWGISVHYIASGALVYAGVSIGLMFLFSLSGSFARACVVGVCSASCVRSQANICPGHCSGWSDSALK